MLRSLLKITILTRRWQIKRTFFLIFCFLSFTGAALAQGQLESVPATSKQEKEAAKTIFSFKKELGLTDQQEESMRKMLASFQSFFTDKRKDYLDEQKELGDLMNKRADLKLIKAKIEALSRIQADITYADIETSRKIEDILTPQQLKMWSKIKEEARNQAQQAQQGTSSKNGG